MSAGVPLHTHARIEGVRHVELLKIVTAEEAASWPEQDVLLWRAGADGSPVLTRAAGDPIMVDALRDERVVRPGDVVRLRPSASLVSVLYRRGSKSNSLFATERCNSLCLMCSQPPRDEDDGWRVSELLKLLTLVDRSEVQLGVTGGEPTLLGDGLAAIVRSAATRLPETTLHVLTNGRRFADRALAEQLATIAPDRVIWAVPLYADNSEVHDEVVGAPGAFAETLQGLFELGRLGARVEIRVVLHKLTTPRLPQLAAFLYRRLPFVEHVALMGLEPMGFAKANRARLWLDPVDYLAELEAALFYLANRGVTASIYNLPLCVLPKGMWPYARQSISDWKNNYPEECASCAVAEFCAGFFASAGPTWRSRAVHPLTLSDVAS
jgi:His-Xaa-Ser system radical SAM maturase HxsC